MLFFANVSVAVDNFSNCFLVFPFVFFVIFRSVVHSVIGCLATLD